MKTPPPGFEPGTEDLEGPCSVQLSYGGLKGEKKTPPLSMKSKSPPSTRILKSLVGCFEGLSNPFLRTELP